MEYLKILKNNNKISRSISYYEKHDIQTATDFTINCILSGEKTFHIGHRKLSLLPDTFLALNKGTQFHSVNDSNAPVDIFSISFDSQFLHDFNSSWLCDDVKLLDEPFLTRQTQELCETLFPFKGDIRFTVLHLKNHLDNGLKDEFLINDYLYHCLINYHQVHHEEILSKAENLNFLNKGTKIEILRRLNLAREYLYSNYNQHITLEDLSEYSCLSVNHLLRTFKQAFNQTPHQYLTTLRLRRAKELLKNTDYPVNEVVSIIGFECPSSFIRLFREHFHTTPLKYRQSA